MRKQLSAAEKRKILAKLVKTPEGREQIAAELVEPLRTYRDYESVGRRAFMVDTLGDGEIPQYDKDADVRAYYVAEEGESVENVIKGDKILVPLFEIATNPTIPITRIRSRKYDVESRVRTKAQQEVFRKEDQKIFNMFSTIVNDAEHVHTPVAVAAAEATIDEFSTAMGQIESMGLRVANIFMNNGNMKILRRIGKDYFEPATTAQLMRTGQMGDLFGAVVHTSPEVATDEIYFCAEPETFGVLAEGVELDVIPADEPKKRVVGWSVFEQVGMVVHNSNGLSVVQLS